MRGDDGASGLDEIAAPGLRVRCDWVQTSAPSSSMKS